MDRNIPWKAINEHLESDHRHINPELSKWIQSSVEHKEIFDELLVIHELTKDVPDTFMPDEAKAWETVYNGIKPSKSKRRYFHLITNVAAAIALLVVGFAISLLVLPKDQPAYTKVLAPKGQKTQIFLPDSSHVYLNGGTSLVYSNDFLNDRKVELNGEALFKVRKNSTPFSVHTDYIDINVFGTQFNVKTFAEDPNVEISLLEGSIGLSDSGHELGRLLPGQIALLDKKTMKIEKRKGDVGKIISWANDELTFDNMTFEEITIYLERWYGVDIELEEALKKNHRYTFNIKTESLRELLNLIDVITPIEYEIKGKKVKIISKN